MWWTNPKGAAMLDHTRSNAILLTAVAFYLATSLVRLHATPPSDRPSWHPLSGVTLASVEAAIKQGIVETAQAENGAVILPGT